MEIVDVLEKIEDNGFEAYVVGGYVRDYVLGIESNDIDICTNARVKDLLNIFDSINVVSHEYGSVKMITDKYNIDITTYRRDLRYNGNRRQVEIEYVDNLVDDINRRDFTMNTLCMNKDKNIIDLLNAKEDINNKLIRCVGDINMRINEDPLRMLRAVRFATILGFRIEENLYEELKKNKMLLKELSLERIKDELAKILVSKNALKGLDYLRRLGYLDIIGINYDKVVNVPDICGMFSQLDIKIEYPFSKEEKSNINDIKSILKYGKIDELVLFDYGLYLSLVAASILGVSKDDVIKIDKSLVIRKIKDIDITSEEICNTLRVKPSKIIKKVYDELKGLILSRELSNDKVSIKKYLSDNGKKWLDEGASKKGFKF